MSFVTPLLLAGLAFGTPVLGDKETELRAYLEAHYANPEKVMARQFVADAMAARLIQSTEDVVLAKQVLRQFHTKKGSHLGRPEGASKTEYGRHGAVINGVADQSELEYNNTVGHAQRIGNGSGTLAGSVDVAGDDDVYHYFKTFAGMLTVSVVGDTLGDPRLEILDSHGNSVAFNDDAVGLDPRIDIFLPAGVYYLRVDGFSSNTGTYTLDVAETAVSTPTVPKNQLVNGNLATSDGTAYRLELAEGSKVDMTFNGGSLDLAVEVITQSGALFFFNDDAVGLDPRVNGYLPAGIYFLRITEFVGNTGAFTFQIDCTPGITAFPCDSTVGGSITETGGFVMYQLTHSGSERVTATTSAAGNSIGDTILFLFDAQLNVLASNDDAIGLFSQLNTTLPAGTYYYVVIGFGGATGDFNLSGVCDVATAPPAISFGTTTASMALGETVNFTLNVNTPLGIEIAVDTPASTIDPVLSVFDSTGSLVLFDDDGGPGLDSLGAGRFGPGSYTIVIRDFGDNSDGDLDVTVRGPLTWDGSRVPSGLGFAGDLVALFAAVGPTPPLHILPGLTDGYLLIDPSSLLLLGTQVIGADGNYSFPAVPGIVPVVQALSFQAGGFPATFTNRLPN